MSTIEGLDQLYQTLNALSNPDLMRGGLMAAGTHLKGKIAEYPAWSSRPQGFKTDLQRRGFFAKRKSGEIEVPYRRVSSPGAESLGRKWTVQAESDTRVVVGNNTSYGPLVQGPQQTAYHQQTGWQTTDDVLAAEAGTVAELVMAQVNQILGG